jgi:hypothetical protein
VLLSFYFILKSSSKSLATRLISSNLRGIDSNDKYFRLLPRVYLIPHQGSTSSTSDGIIKVFEKANKYQETASKENEFKAISVVLLDEGELHLSKYFLFNLYQYTYIRY